MKKLFLAAALAAATLASPALADEVRDRNEALGLCETEGCKIAILLRKIDGKTAVACLRTIYRPRSDHSNPNSADDFLDCYDGLKQTRPDLVLN
jgi:hypothetical protein